MDTEITDTTISAFFAEDLLEYSLVFRGIYWRAERLPHHEAQYSSLEAEAKFIPSIGQAVMMTHSTHDTHVKSESEKGFRFIQTSSGFSVSGFSAQEAFDVIVQEYYTSNDLSLENLLLSLAIIISVCVPCYRCEWYVVLKKAARAIRNMILRYPGNPRTTIRSLQVLCERMFEANSLQDFEITDFTVEPPSEF